MFYSARHLPFPVVPWEMPPVRVLDDACARDGISDVFEHWL